MLTALSDEHDKIAGLDRGADDYVSKPFSFDELSARIRALLRRRGKLVTDNKLEYAEATLDLTTFTLATPKGEIGLTAKEFELLRYMFEYPNFVAAKEDLILKAWGLDSDFESNNLEVYISFIRKNCTTSKPRSLSKRCAAWDTDLFPTTKLKSFRAHDAPDFICLPDLFLNAFHALYHSFENTQRINGNRHNQTFNTQKRKIKVR